MEALGRLIEGKTALIIAHRLASIRNADVILVVEDGTIVESGKHEDLLAFKGLYARLYDAQFNDLGSKVPLTAN